MSGKKFSKNIVVNKRWPGTSRKDTKTPTRIAYKQENPRLTRNVWGYGVNEMYKSYCWTKLLLDDKVQSTIFDDPVLAEDNPGNLMKVPHFRDAAGVCEDYLKCIYEYLIGVLTQQFGEATFDLTAMEIWITLPAIWSDKAKDATLTAARNAGFGSRTDDEIYTISEPEAAMNAVIHEYSGDDTLNPLTVGHCYPRSSSEADPCRWERISSFVTAVEERSI
jgi:hypothetical protein